LYYNSRTSEVKSHPRTTYVDQHLFASSNVCRRDSYDKLDLIKAHTDAYLNHYFPFLSHQQYIYKFERPPCSRQSGTWLRLNLLGKLRVHDSASLPYSQASRLSDHLPNPPLKLPQRTNQISTRPNLYRPDRIAGRLNRLNWPKRWRPVHWTGLNSWTYQMNCTSNVGRCKS